MSTFSNSTIFEVKQVSSTSSSHGVFATSPIPASTTILTDSNPLLALPINHTLPSTNISHPEEKLKLYAQSFVNSEPEERQKWLELCAPELTKDLVQLVNKVSEEVSVGQKG